MATMTIPTTDVAGFIRNLARDNQVSYVATSDDAMAEALTRLADDDVHLDEVERLLLALERAGVIASADVVPLHVNYLREKFAV